MSSKITAFLHHHCPMCLTQMSAPQTLRNHLKSQHEMDLPARKAGVKRPKDPAYEIVTRESDAQLDRFACPSCWSHFSEIQALEEHLNDHIRTDSNMTEATHRQEAHHQEADEEYDEEAAIDTGDRRRSISENEKDALYLEKSNELFSTLDDLIAGFKKLLPYGYANDKNSSK